MMVDNNRGTIISGNLRLIGGRSFQKAILQIIKQESQKSEQFTIEYAVDAFAIINPLIDHCIYFFSLAHMLIVPISADIAVLPIIRELEKEGLAYTPIKKSGKCPANSFCCGKCQT